MVALSVLDLVPVSTTPAAALAATMRAAQIAEDGGYHRYWIAEFHNAPALACGAPMVLAAHVASQTTTIRVGVGGIMMPLHRPRRVAEDLGTLATLHPNRIEAAFTTMQSGAGGQSQQANQTGGGFESNMDSLRRQLAGAEGLYSRAPLSVMGGQVRAGIIAGRFGVPLVVTSHVAPQLLDAVISAYHKSFMPSAQCAHPYVLATANVMVCDSREEAKFQMTTLIQMFEDMVLGKQGLLSPPRRVEIHPAVEARIGQALNVSFAGTGPDVALRLQQWAGAHNIDEVMTVTYAYDPQVREASLEELGNWF